MTCNFEGYVGVGSGSGIGSFFIKNTLSYNYLWNWKFRVKNMKYLI